MSISRCETYRSLTRHFASGSSLIMAWMLYTPPRPSMRKTWPTLITLSPTVFCQGAKSAVGPSIFNARFVARQITQRLCSDAKENETWKLGSLEAVREWMRRALWAGGWEGEAQVKGRDIKSQVGVKLYQIDNKVFNVTILRCKLHSTFDLIWLAHVTSSAY